MVKYILEVLKSGCYLHVKIGQKVHNKVVFKTYDQQQLNLTIDMESLIPLINGCPCFL